MKKLLVNFLLIMTLSSGLLQCYSMEPAKVALKKHKNFDALSSHHPVMKVFNGQQVKISNVHKREKFNDNVRGELELMPKSREDIQGIKQLSYHGKMSPTAEALIGENLSYETTRATTTTTTATTPKTTRITTTTSRPRRRRYKLKKEAPASRVDRFFVKPTKKFKPSPKLPITNEKFQKITPSKTYQKHKPSYVPDDTPFYPLMKPSPINVLPTDPPSFDTVRNYVRYLKLQNEKNYANMHSEEVLPLSKIAVAEKKSIIPFDGEIDYFKEREKQLVEEQISDHKRFSPTTSSSSSDESSAANDNNNSNNDNDPYKVQEDNDYDHDDDDDGGVAVSYGSGSNRNRNSDESEANNSEDYSDANYEESENKEKNFVPFKLYAQVRHAESEAHDAHNHPPKQKMKEKVTLAKKNIYYKEEGKDDEQHERGSSELKLKRKSTKKRTKRSAVEVADLPVALAYIKKSELPNLTGEKLLRHLDELIRNSSIFLPDEDDVERPIRIVSPRKSRNFSNKKYPFYNLSDNILSQMSAHRYSENIGTFPRQKESLYSSKNTKECQEIDEEVDLESKGDDKSVNQHPPPRRLRRLGDKIECLKLKYFGKDPFENPLFKEDEYVTAHIPLPLNHTNVISRTANPLINVYDDVIRTIRSENAQEEKKKNVESVVTTKDSTRLASENVPIRVTTIPARIPNYSSVAGVSQLPIFDINKYLPKFKAPIDDEDIDITELLYGKKNFTSKDTQNSAAAPIKTSRPNSIPLTNYKTDSTAASSLVEKPKVKRNYKSKPSHINELRPPLKAKKQVTIPKFRRVTPHKSHISSNSYSPSRSSYRFKLL